MRPIRIEKSITSRDDEAVRRYLKELEKYQPLSPEQEYEVAMKAVIGDNAAMERLITSNLRFVVSVAKNYEGFKKPLCDLIAEGNIGLIKAAKKFDPSKGFKFISFAVWWIRQAILISIGNHERTVRLPINHLNRIFTISNSKNHLSQLLEREPTNEETSEHSGLSLDKIKESIWTSQHILSLDKPIGDENDATLLELTADNEAAADAKQAENHCSLSIELNETLSKLSNRERFILESFYGLSTGIEQDLDDIAKIIGLTKERTRQIKVSALKKAPGNVAYKKTL